ncbi:MAG: portal protein, partial [bacterium]
MGILLLGDEGSLASLTAEALPEGSRYLKNPTDDEVGEALATRPDAVAIVTRDDVLALRLALLVEAVTPGIHLVVTIFDRTVAERLRSAVPACEVLSFAEGSARLLAEPCLDARPSGGTSPLLRAWDRIV